jgi:hypothetical protein
MIVGFKLQTDDTVNLDFLRSYERERVDRAIAEPLQPHSLTLVATPYWVLQADSLSLIGYR